MSVKKRRVILPWVILTLVLFGALGGGGYFWYTQSIGPMLQAQERLIVVASQQPTKPTLSPEQEALDAQKKLELLEKQIQTYTNLFFDIMTKLITLLGSISGLVITFLTIKEKTKALKRREPAHVS